MSKSLLSQEFLIYLPSYKKDAGIYSPVCVLILLYHVNS
jgi:hypothetical protein